MNTWEISGLVDFHCDLISPKVTLIIFIGSSCEGSVQSLCHIGPGVWLAPTADGLMDHGSFSLCPCFLFPHVH